MTRKLASFVSVHSKDGNSGTFGPDDVVPAWAAKLITNPDAWADGEAADMAEGSDDEDAGTTDAGDAGDTGADEGESSDESDSEDADGEAADISVTIPPKSGPGSSAKAWAEYAAAKGFEVDGDARATEIREALAEAGIPTE